MILHTYDPLHGKKIMFEDDYWDSPGYNDFWRGAPGLPPHSRTRITYGPRQVKSPEELLVGGRYILHEFTGVRVFDLDIVMTGKDDGGFVYITVLPEEVRHAFGGEAVYLGQKTFSKSSIRPCADGLWDNASYILRIAE